METLNTGLSREALAADVARENDLVWLRWLVWLAGVLGLEVPFGKGSLAGLRRVAREDWRRLEGVGDLACSDWDAEALLAAVAQSRTHSRQFAASHAALHLACRHYLETRRGCALLAKAAFCLRYSSTVFASWRRLFATFTDFSRTVRGDVRLPAGRPRACERDADPPERWHLPHRSPSPRGSSAGLLALDHLWGARRSPRQ